MPFTIQNAQALINLARRAPLQNMDEAETARGLLDAFAAWANVALAPPAPAAEEDAPPPLE